ncbi:hypothetical protein HYFRA_00001888 [Hymenoscyphus fraxineus]|uniref:Uncharacterized protein n=1 Tax=Hymenoscyphus fraxineus TaxID=746836 RepID=A0A9N9KKW2_9HELO|nr:hypothetical protein HYFRA_00001888 [Hymenoscyphus fraxineus]
MQFAITAVFALVALLSTLSTAAPPDSLDSLQTSTGTARVQLDGNDPAGEDAIQKDIVLDGSAQRTGDRVLIKVSVVEGNANCQLFSDLNGLKSINKPFSSGKNVVINPPTLVRSIRCKAGAAQPPPQAPKPIVGTITVQLDGNDPPGEDAIQKSIVLDGSAQATGDRVLFAVSIVKGSGNCKLFSDLNGNAPISKPFSPGKLFKINPPTLVRSIRCTA